MSLVIPIITTTLFTAVSSSYQVWRTKQVAECRFVIKQDAYGNELFQYKWWAHGKRSQIREIPDFQYKGKEILREVANSNTAHEIRKYFHKEMLELIENGAKRGHIIAPKARINYKSIGVNMLTGLAIGIVLEITRNGIIMVWDGLMYLIRPKSTKSKY